MAAVLAAVPQKLGKMNDTVIVNKIVDLLEHSILVAGTRSEILVKIYSAVTYDKSRIVLMLFRIIKVGKIPDHSYSRTDLLRYSTVHGL